MCRVREPQDACAFFVLCMLALFSFACDGIVQENFGKKNSTYKESSTHKEGRQEVPDGVAVGWNTDYFSHVLQGHIDAGSIRVSQFVLSMPQSNSKYQEYDKGYYTEYKSARQEHCETMIKEKLLHLDAATICAEKKEKTTFPTYEQSILYKPYVASKGIASDKKVIKNLADNFYWFIDNELGVRGADPDYYGFYHKRNNSTKNPSPVKDIFVSRFHGVRTALDAYDEGVTYRNNLMFIDEHRIVVDVFISKDFKGTVRVFLDADNTYARGVSAKYGAFGKTRSSFVYGTKLSNALTQKLRNNTIAPYMDAGAKLGLSADDPVVITPLANPKVVRLLMQAAEEVQDPRLALITTDGVNNAEVRITSFSEGAKKERTLSLNSKVDKLYTRYQWVFENAGKKKLSELFRTKKIP